MNGSAFVPQPSPLKLFSIVIPARDEEAALPPTLRDLHATLLREGVPHEFVVIDDGSTDRTWAVLQELRREIPTLEPVQNPGPHGFGRAVVCGFNHMHGDACAVVMADASDSPEDAVKYWRLLNDGWECVFGSRFIRGGRVVDYPRVKLFVNRLANLFIRIFFPDARNTQQANHPGLRLDAFVLQRHQDILSPAEQLGKVFVFRNHFYQSIRNAGRVEAGFPGGDHLF